MITNRNLGPSLYISGSLKSGLWTFTKSTIQSNKATSTLCCCQNLSLSKSIAGEEVGGNYSGRRTEYKLRTMTATLLLSSIKMNSVPPPEAFPQYNNSLPGSGSGSGSGSLSITKRSWVVKTESNVWKEETKKPNPPCVGCGGSGEVNCRYCRGRGRTNCVHLAVLPKGEWPKWCKICGGSGLEYCSWCNGTGEHKNSIRFQFTRKNG